MAVLIFGEVVEGRLSPATQRLSAAGAQLAAALGEPLVGALIGEELTAAAEAFDCGVKTLYLVEAPHLRPYTADAFISAAQGAIEASAASIVLFAHGADTREWVPRLAARIGAG